jgi:hypothetical protein
MYRKEYAMIALSSERCPNIKDEWTAEPASALGDPFFESSQNGPF